MTTREEEIATFDEFAKALNLRPNDVTVPNAPGIETGIDILASVAGKRIGVQLTVYHADEAPDQRGSPLRSEEEKKARAALAQDGPKTYGHWAPGDYFPPLTCRISEKVTKAKTYSYDVDELWLLVCAQYPRYGAFLLSARVRLGALAWALNCFVHESLFVVPALFGERPS